jgi:hypothetical protein
MFGVVHPLIFTKMKENRIIKITVSVGNKMALSKCNVLVRYKN